MRAAAALARLAGARLHVVHAAAHADRGEEERLRERLAALSPQGEEEAEVLAPAGPPHEVILQTAARVHADVVVLGPHRSGGVGPLGSTAERVVRGAEAPCLVVPCPLDLPLHRVVAAIETSDSGRGALLVALTWASALRRPSTSLDGERDSATCIDALHVADEGSGPPDLASLGEYVATVVGMSGAFAGVRIETVVRDAGESGEEVADAVARYVRERGAGLLVLGTRNLAPPDAPALGSVSAVVVRDAPAPVLLVPPAVWGRAVAEPVPAPGASGRGTPNSPE